MVQKWGSFAEVKNGIYYRKASWEVLASLLTFQYSNVFKPWIQLFASIILILCARKFWIWAYEQLVVNGFTLHHLMLVYVVVGMVMSAIILGVFWIKGFRWVKNMIYKQFYSIHDSIVGTGLTFNHYSWVENSAHKQQQNVCLVAWYLALLALTCNLVQWSVTLNFGSLFVLYLVYVLMFAMFSLFVLKMSQKPASVFVLAGRLVSFQFIAWRATFALIWGIIRLALAEFWVPARVVICPVYGFSLLSETGAATKATWKHESSAIRRASSLSNMFTPVDCRRDSVGRLNCGGSKRTIVTSGKSLATEIGNVKLESFRSKDSTGVVRWVKPRPLDEIDVGRARSMEEAVLSFQELAAHPAGHKLWAFITINADFLMDATLNGASRSSHDKFKNSVRRLTATTSSIATSGADDRSYLLFALFGIQSKVGPGELVSAVVNISSYGRTRQKFFENYLVLHGILDLGQRISDLRQAVDQQATQPGDFAYASKKDLVGGKLSRSVVRTSQAKFPTSLVLDDVIKQAGKTENVTENSVVLREFEAVAHSDTREKLASYDKKLTNIYDFKLTSKTDREEFVTFLKQQNDLVTELGVFDKVKEAVDMYIEENATKGVGILSIKKPNNFVWHDEINSKRKDA